MSEKQSHKSVWIKFIGSDTNAILELYNQHSVGLINYGRFIIDDEEFVNDCLMDMILEFWNKRSSLSEVENVRSYLMTSLRRHIIHQLNAKKRRDVMHTEFEQLNDTKQVSFEEHFIRIQTNDEVKKKLSKALTKLSERQLELIRLKYFEDLDYDEIAERCQITKRTAYNTIYDTLKILKQELYTGNNGGKGFQFGLGFELYTENRKPVPEVSNTAFAWGGLYGTAYIIDPANNMIALFYLNMLKHEDLYPLFLSNAYQVFQK